MITIFIDGKCHGHKIIGDGPLRRFPFRHFSLPNPNPEGLTPNPNPIPNPNPNTNADSNCNP